MHLPSLYQMQRWEDKHKQKVHDSIVDNAKSTFKRYSHSRDKILSTSRSKPSHKRDLPINKILEIFHLQHYSSLLVAHGYPHRLTQKDSLHYIEEMLDEVAEEDKQRFLSLLNTLAIMSKEVKKPMKTPIAATKSRKTIYPPPSTSTYAKRTPTSLQKTEKTTSKFRIKNKQTTHHPIDDLRRPPRSPYDRSVPRRRKSVAQSKAGAKDDLSLTHDFRSHASGKICPVKETSKILQRLAQRLEAIEPSHNNGSSEQLKLELDKIKEMYLSFDSATLSSNISNIDLQQMIDCLALQVIHLVESAAVNQIVKDNAQKIKSLLRESFIMVKEESDSTQRDEKEMNDDSKKGKKESMSSQKELKRSKEKAFRAMKQPENGLVEQEIDEPKASEISSDNDACSIGSIEDGELGGSSSIWGNSFIGSIITDFSCFDCRFKESYYTQKPHIEDVKNFLQLIVMAGKLEKEVPIIAYVYLSRLLGLAPGAKMNARNWRNVILVCLVQASKIWDDQSLQNHSFASVIKPYTTLEINRLEKYLLFFLDYRLNVNQEQYSEAYFKLRRHAGESSHTAHLMRLDLKTIKKLQGSGSKQPCKKEFLRKCMNKSF